MLRGLARPAEISARAYSIRHYNVMTADTSWFTGVISFCSFVHLGKQLLIKVGLIQSGAKSSIV